MATHPKGPMSNPCIRCLTSPKIPGQGQRYCLQCKADLGMSVVDSQRVSVKSASEKIIATRTMNKAAPAGTKWCPECRKYLSLSSFKRGGKASYCSRCAIHVSYSSFIRRTYGITLNQYYEILDGQGGGCAICLRVLKTKKYSVDHNHKTGEVRGLLCNPCNNRILGTARDDPATLRRAADYLEEPPARAILAQLQDRSNP